jgi:hypothetical protein
MTILLPTSFPRRREPNQHSLDPRFHGDDNRGHEDDNRVHGDDNTGRTQGTTMGDTGGNTIHGGQYNSRGAIQFTGVTTLSFVLPA